MGVRHLGVVSAGHNPNGALDMVCVHVICASANGSKRDVGILESSSA